MKKHEVEKSELRKDLEKELESLVYRVRHEQGMPMSVVEDIKKRMVEIGLEFKKMEVYDAESNT